MGRLEAHPDGHHRDERHPSSRGGGSQLGPNGVDHHHLCSHHSFLATANLVRISLSVSSLAQLPLDSAWHSILGL